MSEDITIEHDADHDRYVLLHGDREIGVALYRDTAEGRLFTHTEVAPDEAHQGLGTRLVRAALDDTRAAALRPIAGCSMVRNFLAEHPDYANPIRR